MLGAFRQTSLVARSSRLDKSDSDSGMLEHNKTLFDFWASVEEQDGLAICCIVACDSDGQLLLL